MQPNEELKNLVLRHYGKFDSGEQAESIHGMYSQEDGVVLIGAERDEWIADRESIQAAIKEGSASQMNIDVHDIEARSEGSVGWTMDRVSVKLPNGVEIPMRHTRIFHKEDGGWKMVHLHASVAVPNEKIGI
jgi:ketosteroid isomerase-like protein